MLKASKAQLRIMAALALTAIPAIASAQSYYDDDIYYDASKDKSTKKVTATRSTTTNVYTPSATVILPGSDTYIVNTGNTRDVDEYNRHGQFLVPDTITGDSAIADAYGNTRRIQRFHNSDIIDNLSNDDYAVYVNTDPAVVNVNVYSNPWSWGSPYYSSWGWGYPYGSWYYPYSWSNFWWDLAWGPSWSWGWGPSWGPGWGWGPSWGWGNSWAPGWGGVAWRPQTPAGSSRPHGTGLAANRGNSARPVANSSFNNGRPGNGGHGYGTSSRPGASGHYGAPSNSNSGGYGTYTGNRGRNSVGNTSTQQRTPATNSNNSNRSTYNSNRSNNNSNRSSYNSGSSGRSSYGSGSSYGGNRGGGTHGTGGGGGRGRGR